MVSALYFRPLRFGEVFTRVLDVFYEEFIVFAKLSAVTVLPQVVVAAAVFWLMFDMDAPLFGDTIVNPTRGVERLENHLTSFFMLTTYEIVLVFILTLIGQGAMVRATTQLYLGQDANWHSCWKDSLKRARTLQFAGLILFGCLLSTMLVPYGIFALGMHKGSYFIMATSLLLHAAWFVAFVYIMVCAMLVFPAIMVERLSSVEGITRAIELARQRWCFLFGVAVSYGSIKFAIQYLVQKVLLGEDPMDCVSAGGVLATLLPSIVFLPVTSIVNTVLYVHLRVDIEGMNGETLRSEVDPQEYAPVPGKPSYTSKEVLSDDQDLDKALL